MLIEMWIKSINHRFYDQAVHDTSEDNTKQQEEGNEFYI